MTRTNEHRRVMAYRLAAYTVALSGLLVFALMRVSAASVTPVAPTPAAAAAPPAVPPAKAASPCAGNQPAKAVIVSLAGQHLWACQGTVEVYDSAVTTGMTVIRNGVDDHTPTGTWRITAKYTDLHLRGRDANGSWDDPVRYWMPFAGDIGFHDASWQTFAFGSQQYRTDGSHGCVHLPSPAMQWLYGWADIGTSVTIDNQ